MISQDWCYNKRKVPAGAAGPVVWIERQENNMHISYKPVSYTHLRAAEQTKAIPEYPAAVKKPLQGEKAAKTTPADNTFPACKAGALPAELNPHIRF